MTTPLHVLVTGAAGQIGYVLAFRIANGDLFGDRKVVLHLLEIRPGMPMLESVVMELHDCTFPNLDSIIGTCDVEQAFRDVDYAFLIGSIPKKANMTMDSYIERNCAIFKEQGQALSQFSKRTVKVLVVGLPANTNCLVCSNFATNILKENFCAMTRLDHNRAVGELARKLQVASEDIRKVVVWGNRSKTQIPDASSALCRDRLVRDILDDEYMNGEFVECLEARGVKVAGMRGPSTAASAAHAAICHMRDWIHGTREGDFVSMAIPVPDNEPYGIKKGIVFSLPCTVDGEGRIHVVEGLEVPAATQERIAVNDEELRNEARLAEEILSRQSQNRM